jgi:hypothetical protein
MFLHICVEFVVEPRTGASIHFGADARTKKNSDCAGPFFLSLAASRSILELQPGTAVALPAFRGVARVDRPTLVKTLRDI